MTIEVLIVDDSAAERLFISHFIARSDEFHATFASDGIEALQSVAARPPGLIVSDIRMPRMNGLDLIRALSATGKHIPVVLMTSFGSEEIAVEALHAGAASYVPKRCLDTELIRTLRSVLAVTTRRQNRRQTLRNLTFQESHFVVENDPSTISGLVSHILDQTIAMKVLHGQEVTQVGIALQEVLTNAINHGNLELDPRLRHSDSEAYFELADRRRREAPYAHRRVFIEMRLDQTELRFVVRDEGSGFAAGSVMDGLNKPQLEQVNGRGLMLVNSFMDSVSHNETGNEITMTKYVSGSHLPAENRFASMAMLASRSLCRE